MRYKRRTKQKNDVTKFYAEKMGCAQERTRNKKVKIHR